MPEVARKSGADSVQAPHGSGVNCATPTVFSTNEGSSKVFVENIGAVREGDVMETHPNVGCVSHSPTLSSYSSKVFVENKGIGRKGDAYNGHTILTGSGKVVAG